MWLLTVYEVPLSKVERMEKIINSFVRKWLGVPRCLSSVAMYGKGIVELPISSLTEEFKCAKVDWNDSYLLKQVVQLNLPLGIGVWWAVGGLREGRR